MFEAEGVKLERGPPSQLGPRSSPARRLHAALADAYGGCDDVRVMNRAAGGRREAQALNGTNRLELYVQANENQRQAVLVVRLDNLGKGASGAAVQNLELMLGLNGALSQ